MISYIIAFIMLFSFSACGSNPNTTMIPDDTQSITIPSADTRIDVVPGNIVLYNSNQNFYFFMISLVGLTLNLVT